MSDYFSGSELKGEVFLGASAAAYFEVPPGSLRKRSAASVGLG